MKRVVFILLLVIVLVLSMYNITYAASVDDVISGADDFISSASKQEHVGFKWEGITNASDLIYNTLLTIGIVAIVIVGLILGIKYITSSVEGQAKVKETLIPYFVGSIVILGAFGIWKLVTEIIQSAV